MLTGKFMVENTYVRKEIKSQINNQSFHFKNLEKEEQTKSNVSWKKETIKIRGEINKMESRKPVEKVNVGSLEKSTKLSNF